MRKTLLLPHSGHSTLAQISESLLIKAVANTVTAFLQRFGFRLKPRPIKPNDRRTCERIVDAQQSSVEIILIRSRFLTIMGRVLDYSRGGYCIQVDTPTKLGQVERVLIKMVHPSPHPMQFRPYSFFRIVHIDSTNRLVRLAVEERL